MQSDAQDLTQHTFQVWATKGHQLRDTTKVKTWLYTTLHRAFLRARRKEGRFPHQVWDEVIEQVPAVFPPHSNDVDSLQLLSALARVNPLYHDAVVLFYLEDHAYKDIAIILDVPVGTVKSRVARGIAQLREILRADEAQLSALSQCRYGAWGFSTGMRLETSGVNRLTLGPPSRLTAATN